MKRARLWINYNRRGWRGEEPLDAMLKHEQPKVLRRSVELLIDEGVRTRQQVVDDLALPPREIEELCALPSGYLRGSTADIKALPRLKVEAGVNVERSGEVISIFNRKRLD